MVSGALAKSVDSNSTGDTLLGGKVDGKVEVGFETSRVSFDSVLWTKLTGMRP